MLPDFPSIKEALQKKILALLVENAKKQTGILALVPTMRIFEGDRWAYTAEEDSKIEATTSEIRLTDDQLESNSIEDNIRVLELVVDDIIGKIARGIMDMARAAAADGHPKFSLAEDMSPSAILKMMEQYQLEFTPDGRPIMGQFIQDPSQIGKFRALFSDSEFRQRWEAMIDRQRIAFNDRESHRKLVG